MPSSFGKVYQIQKLGNIENPSTRLRSTEDLAQDIFLFFDPPPHRKWSGKIFMEKNKRPVPEAPSAL
jgi:hypothetical protein